MTERHQAHRLENLLLLQSMSILTNTIYRFNGIPLKILIIFFSEIEIHLKIHLEFQGSPNNKNSYVNK